MGVKQMFDEKIVLKYASMPFAPPAEILKELCAEITKSNRYPDETYAELKETIAVANGVEKQNVAVGDGSHELIDMLTLAFGKTVLIPTPTFGRYAHSAKVYNSKIFLENCFDGRNYAFRLSADLMLKSTLIWICNPNNPTGNKIERNEILRIANAAKQALVVVDEAFYDFSKETVADEIKKRNNLAVLRTFSKAHCMAGLRLGYLMAPAHVIEKIEKIRQPFNVSNIAARAGVLALKKDSLFHDVRREIEETRDYFSKKMEEAGYSVLPSATTFVLVSFKDAEEAKNAYNELEKRSIYVLPPWDTEFTGMPKNCFRITIGTRQEMDIVIEALKEIKQQVLA